MAINQTPELERALQLAADRHASDLFLIPGEPIALRIKGKIERTEGEPLTAADVRRVAVAAVGDERLAALGTETSRVITSCELPGVVVGRMCIASARGEPTIVVNILPSCTWSPQELGIPDVVLQNAHVPSGLVIFAGLPGSGKITSMLSVLDDFNAKFESHICTVEDPIGPVLTPKRSIVQQREVGVDVPDVVSGIAAAMRQDLDVLMVGEIKTAEELQACLAAAETGHLVYTQVHAQLPTVALQRLLDVQRAEESQALRFQVFCERLARVLRCVMCQMLVPGADGKSRVGVYSLLVPDEQIRGQIARGEPLRPRSEPWPEDCLTYRDHILLLRQQGRITEETANRAASLPEEL
jgi:twitching motility protein PilT